MFKNFLKTTFRNLSKNKGYSFLNIFGLAIGIACAGFIFLWVEDEVHFDSKLVDIFNCRDCCDSHRFNNGEFPGGKSSGGKPCEELEE